MGTTKYFINVFAQGGFRTAVPDQAVPAGTVSYENGWTEPYSLPYPSDPTALPVSRPSWNQVMYDATLSLQQYQQFGTPNFITTADNEGSPFLYSKDAFALYDDGANGVRLFQSLENSNNTLPTDKSKWVWVRNSAGNINLQNVTFSVSVTEGMAVYLNNGVFSPAVANNSNAKNVVGIASVALNTVFQFGQCNNILSGLTPGAPYYLSTTTPGSITTTRSSILIGAAYSATSLNINLFKSEADWTPMYISGLYMYPGFSPTTMYSIRAGKCRDLSNLVNAYLNNPLQDKNVTLTWSAGNSGGAVPSNILSSWLSGVPSDNTIHIFLIVKSDGVTCDSAIDTSITGANILADPVIAAAGYIYVRRIDSTYVRSAGTIVPFARVGMTCKRFDSFGIPPLPGVVNFNYSPQVIRFGIPALPYCVAIFGLEIPQPSITDYDIQATIYEIGAQSPGSQYHNHAQYGDSPGDFFKEGPNSNASSQVIAFNGQANIIFTGTNKPEAVAYISSVGWIDTRETF